MSSVMNGSASVHRHHAVATDPDQLNGDGIYEDNMLREDTSSIEAVFFDERGVEEDEDDEDGVEDPWYLDGGLGWMATRRRSCRSCRRRFCPFMCLEVERGEPWWWGCMMNVLVASAGCCLVLGVLLLALFFAVILASIALSWVGMY